MYAESETQTLSFKNICAVLAIKVTSEDIATLKSIKVKADKKLNGPFTVASTTDGYKAVIGTDGTEEVVLSSSDEITLTSEGTTFYIAIPEQEYSYLKIYLSEDGTLYKRAMITKKAVGTVSCNKIYNIDYQTNAVQLYANGPYWSTMNIGATTPTDYGCYFSWGNTTGYVYDSTNKWVKASDNTTKLGTDGSFSQDNYNDPAVSGNGINLTENIPVGAEYDAAYANWGAAWRMPTGGDSGQFQALYDNTENDWAEDYNSTGIKGATFTGKDLFSDITLFFPAAGYGYDTDLRGPGSDDDGYGYYWSSSLYTEDTNFAHLFYFAWDEVFPEDANNRYDGFSVRPVSD